MNMNQTDLIHEIAKKMGASISEASRFLQVLQEVLIAVLEEKGDLIWRGVGTFGVKSRAARVGRHPRTGAVLQIPAMDAPFLRFSPALKLALNGQKKIVKRAGKGIPKS